MKNFHLFECQKYKFHKYTFIIKLYQILFDNNIVIFENF